MDLPFCVFNAKHPRMPGTYQVAGGEGRVQEGGDSRTRKKEIRSPTMGGGLSSDRDGVGVGRINPNKGTVKGQWPPPCESLLREAPKAPKPQGLLPYPRL